MCQCVNQHTTQNNTHTTYIHTPNTLMSTYNNTHKHNRLTSSSVCESDQLHLIEVRRQLPITHSEWTTSMSVNKNIKHIMMSTNSPPRPLFIHCTFILMVNKYFPDITVTIRHETIGFWQLGMKMKQNRINSRWNKIDQRANGFRTRNIYVPIELENKLWKEPVETTRPVAQTIISWFLYVNCQTFWENNLQIDDR